MLIIGGGDCGIAEEVLKHKALKSVVQVEIDESVVEFSKEHFPEFTKPVFTDKRFESVIADGMKYVAETERRFDVIIVDSTDPQGPGAVLFTKEFYAACKRCMAPGGVMVTQNGVPFFQPDELISSVGMFKGLFADGACYVAAIPTYVGGHMAMGWAAKDRKLRQHPRAHDRGALPEGGQLQDQILDARGARRGLRAAALHRRARQGREEAVAASFRGTPKRVSPEVMATGGRSCSRRWARGHGFASSLAALGPRNDALLRLAEQPLAVLVRDAPRLIVAAIARATRDRSS